MSDTILEVKNLKTYFYTEEGVVPAVDGLDFTLRDGETLAIVGESGCGKSVTSLSILRLIKDPPGRIIDGEILYRGEDLCKLPEKRLRQIRGDEISMIFQEPMTSLNPVFTVGRQIMESLIYHQSCPQAEAKALACSPKILIADEPTTALDVTIQAQILRLLTELRKKTGTAIILITHDLGIVAQTAENVMVMYGGQAVEYSDVRSIYKDPLHPYTVGLLKSIPKLHEEQDKLYNIKGSIPSPQEFPKGCRFSPRCEDCMDICKDRMPELITLEDGRKVRCWKYQKTTGGEGR